MATLLLVQLHYRNSILIKLRACNRRELIQKSGLNGKCSQL